MLSTRQRSSEAASALIGAIAVLVLASFVIVAIMVSGRSSLDSARSKLDQSANEQLARDAGTMLSGAYSTLASGEQDGFVPSQGVLKDYAAKLNGGDVIANPSAVDNTRIPANRRYTMVQSLNDGRRGYWQVYSAALPTWGTTKGGRVSIYVRTWTDGGAGTKTSQPMVYRLDLRPTWFADYQMLVDGPLWFGASAKIRGRVHSNGYSSSFFDQYRSLVNAGIQIKFDGGCASTANISTANGKVSGPASCTSVSKPNTGERINLLRAKDLAARLRWVCTLPAAQRKGIDIKCLTSTGTTNVKLSGTTLSYTGGSLNAKVAGTRPDQNQGAVLVTSGNVVLSGALGSTAKARALVVAASPPGAANFATGSVPSAWIKQAGSVGSSPNEANSASSFGLVVEGDIIFDQATACSITARGAFTTISGMMSINPTWRIPVDVGNGPNCGGTAAIHGSIAGHDPPIMIQSANQAGYANRDYDSLDSLYDNPPPLYPTASDWMVTHFAPANLDCFAKSGSTYTLASVSCV